MAEEDLWGDLSVAEKIETPVSILRVQANLLKAKTRGLLEGRVVSANDNDGTFVHDLRIVVPSLGNYSAMILEVQHRKFLYPASVISTTSEKWTAVGDANNSEDFKDLIAKVLRSPEVHRIVAALLAQVSDAIAPGAVGGSLS